VATNESAGAAISANGTSWTELWSDGVLSITEDAWSTQTYDISDVADGEDTVWIRWSYQVSFGAWAYSGWNIDDVQILAAPDEIN
jgi:hypothetical protein